MPSFTPLIVITEAFEEIGAISPGETPSATMQAKGLLLFNGLLSQCASEGVMNPTKQVDIAVGIKAPTLAEYTVGTGVSADLAVNYPPIRITAWRSILAPFQTSGLIISMDQYREEVGKRPASAPSSALPEFIGAMQTWGTFLTASPTVTQRIGIWPPPATVNGTLYLDYYRALDTAALVSTVMYFPDAWFDYLSSNLALALEPTYRRVGGISEGLAARAQNAKQIIVTNNAAILGLSMKAA